MKIIGSIGLGAMGGAYAKFLLGDNYKVYGIDPDENNAKMCTSFGGELMSNISDLLNKSDEEIFAIAKPFWENLVKSSNLKDYGGFTRDFSTQMLFGANEVELGKQWANNKVITNLHETYNPFGTLRRGDHITVLIKQTNKELPGEFLGRLVLGVEDDEVKIFGATIY